MIPFEQLSDQLDKDWASADPKFAASQLLAIGEAVLENWVSSQGHEPTHECKEGFRLLALHRQGAKGIPSFNACRETCRELAYHYNLVTMGDASDEKSNQVKMMVMVAKHLLLFVSGKMQVEGLGEFCCASKPLRSEAALS